MFDTETLYDFEEMFFIEADKGTLTIECNLCSEDDYLFSRTHDDDSVRTGWVARGLAHFVKHHPEVAPGRDR